ncbi:helix-turn-helix domain-containing protein [Rahnella sp. PAMC25617]|jgi:Ner family transcriptional regulator|uniref:helix-turn-helix domain-containing protein n=1 Tax=Rahnella TaxID=34037 RepID=UPI000DD4990D|nr:MULTISPECIES: helix-turn-helix transcriptional regulator [Rahnella]MDH2896436.1 helix-turn-helix domain-containing protein [Rahnella variigena]TCQ87564.1 Nlp family transcriptional regulator [Rahnella sp. JUb53]
MTTNYPPKISFPFQDWHPADIIAALRKKGTTLAAVSRAAGLGSSTLSNALSRPWPKGELLIGQAIGVPPSTIWPSRYFNPVTMEFVDRPLRPAYKRAATSE